MGFKWSRKNVLVTGGIGFIGSNLVFRLVDLGATITVVDQLKITTQSTIWKRKLDHYKSLWRNKGFSLSEEYIPRFIVKAGDHVALNVVDLSQEASLLEDILNKREIDIVFHMAAVFGGRAFVDNNQADCAVGFAINHNVISSAQRANVNHVHFASSACVYPPSLNKKDYLLSETDILSTGEAWQSSDNVYGFVKLMGELELKAYYEQYGLKGSTARYLTVYGPGEFDESHAIATFMARAIRREDPFEVWGDGSQERGFTYVEDIVEGVIKCTENIDDVTPLNLGWDKRYKIRDVVETVTRTAGYSPKIVYDPTKPTGPYSRALDISRARKLLDWSPKIDIQEGIQRTYEWASKKQLS